MKIETDAALFSSMALGLVTPQVDLSLLMPSSTTTTLSNNVETVPDAAENDVSPTATVINSPGNLLKFYF